MDDFLSFINQSCIGMVLAPRYTSVLLGLEYCSPISVEAGIFIFIRYYHLLCSNQISPSSERFSLTGPALWGYHQTTISLFPLARGDQLLIALLKIMPIDNSYPYKALQS